MRSCAPLRINNGDAVLSAAIAGFGIAALPAFIVHGLLLERSLEQILPDWQVSRTNLYLPTRPDGSPPVRVQALADYRMQRRSRL